MRIVAISRVLDEADIIEAFVRHNAAHVQHHVFMDNGSVDGTIEILRALKQEGAPITVFQNRCVSANEASHLTFLYRQAVARHAADWVACLDADEFLDARMTGAGLPDLLNRLEPGISGIEVPMVEYVATSGDAAAESVVPIRIRKRRQPTDNCKVIARAGPARIDVEILSGGHGLKEGHLPGHVLQQDVVRLAHYAERSPFQYIAKFVRGWNKVLAAGAAVAASGHSYHYKAPYEALRDRPGDLLRNAHFMGFKNEAPGLIDDPIAYAGGTLRYLPAHDDALRAVRTLMGTVQELALRHGALLDAFPDVRKQVALWDLQFGKLF